MSTKKNTASPVYTLKSFKSFQQMSDETLCCHANLYRDGKKIGTISNQGCGGPTDFDGSRDELEILMAHVDTFPQESFESGGDTHFYNKTVDCFLSELTEAAEELKWRKSQCSRKTLFRLVGDDDSQWRVIGHKFSQNVHDYLIKTHGDKLGEIMNLTNKGIK